MTQILLHLSLAAKILFFGLVAFLLVSLVYWGIEITKFRRENVQQ